MSQFTTIDTLVYVVTAFRFGQRLNHNYVVGVYSSLDLAVSVAAQHEQHRGGKYRCEVVERDIDQRPDDEGDFDGDVTTKRFLPEELPENRRAAICHRQKEWRIREANKDVTALAEKLVRGQSSQRSRIDTFCHSFKDFGKTLRGIQERLTQRDKEVARWEVLAKEKPNGP